MTGDSVLIRVADRGVFLRLRVKPGSRRNRIVGAYGGALKLEVSAAPEKGKANKAVKKLLANTFDVPPSSIDIFTGETSQDKSIRIENLTTEGIARKLATLGIAANQG